MNTALIAIIISLLASLPAGTTLEFHGERVEPKVIIRELKSMQKEEAKKVEEVKEKKAEPVKKPSGVKAPPMRPVSA